MIQLPQLQSFMDFYFFIPTSTCSSWRFVFTQVVRSLSVNRCDVDYILLSDVDAKKSKAKRCFSFKRIQVLSNIYKWWLDFNMLTSFWFIFCRFVSYFDLSLTIELISLLLSDPGLPVFDIHLIYVSVSLFWMLLNWFICIWLEIFLWLDFSRFRLTMILIYLPSQWIYFKSLKFRNFAEPSSKN